MSTESESSPDRARGPSAPKPSAGGDAARADDASSSISSDGAEDSPLDDRAGVCGIDLSAARGVLGRVLGRCGSEHWTAVEFKLEAAREVACLEQWAREFGAWLPPERIPTWGDSQQFGEHHLKKVGQRVWKATKLHRFGIYPICSGRARGSPADQLERGNGTPHQYLSRLLLLNGWFRSLASDFCEMELTRFEGVGSFAEEVSILTSQPFFKRDRHLEEPEISTWLSGLGFRCATAGIWYDPTQNLALFDVKPSNVILSHGRFIPIDLIPIQPSGVMKYVLTSAIS